MHCENWDKPECQGNVYILLLTEVGAFRLCRECWENRLRRRRGDFRAFLPAQPAWRSIDEFGGL